MSSAQDKARQQALNKRKAKRTNLAGLEALVQGVKSGNVVALSQAITLIESTSSSDRVWADYILEHCLGTHHNTLRLGITGVPGVGKSSFIESFGMLAIERGYKVAVLAVDPSSGLNRGSILGDKTRMQKLSTHPQAFVRPSPAAKSLGGVASKTREAMLLCESAGFNLVIIETVGVGQSETAVKSMCDFFLLLMLSGAGDELQGIKRGIMEMADALLITKADGQNIDAAKKAAQEYRRALHLFPASKNQWPISVASCSALTGEGLNDFMEELMRFKQNRKAIIKKARASQNQQWFVDYVNQLWNEKLFENVSTEHMNKLLEAAAQNNSNPRKMAQELMHAINLK